MNTIISILVFILITYFIIMIIPVLLPLLLLAILAIVGYSLYIRHKVQKQLDEMDDQMQEFVDSMYDEQDQPYRNANQGRTEDVIDVEYTETEEEDN